MDTLDVIIAVLTVALCGFVAYKTWGKRSSGTAALWFDVERSADCITVRPKWWQLVNNLLFHLFVAALCGTVGYYALRALFDTSIAEKEPFPRALQVGMQLLFGLGFGYLGVVSGLHVFGWLVQGRTPTVLDRKKEAIYQGRQPLCAMADIARLEIHCESHVDGGEFYQIGYVLTDDSQKVFHHLFDGGYANLADVQAFAAELGAFLGREVKTCKT